MINNYTSSPIQSERILNQSLRKRINGQNANILIKTTTSLQQQNFLDSENKRKNDNINMNIIQSYGSSSSGFNKFIKKRSFISNEQNNRQQDTQRQINETYQNLILDSSKYLEREKQNMYYLSKSLPSSIDEIVKLNFDQLANKKWEIENIYKQLRREQDEIERAYEEYKKGYKSVNQSSIGRQMPESKGANSPPKKFITKKSFSKTKKEEEIQSKMSTIQKQQESIINGKQPSFNNTLKINQQSHITSQNNQKASYKSKNNEKIQKYCTEEFQSIQIPNKPQPMTAKSHIFVPFNKLFKSPILQMKNQNTLILARQSKILPQKNNQQKIVDGKKFKFPNNVQTDEQQLIKNVIKEGQHHIIAIVGGQTTLKKKLHISFIAHMLDKILKIIYSKQYNCLALKMTYIENIQKPSNSQLKIENEVQITQQKPIKVSILEIQKTIEQICEQIKKTHNQSESSFSKNPTLLNQKEKTKVLRFTKIQLQSGKEVVWSCHLLSVNQYNFEFLQNLQIKDIIWSVNPLVKNYEEVCKTLNESMRYIEAKLEM